MFESDFVRVPRPFIRKFNLNSAVMLSEIYSEYTYWKDRDGLQSGGWFFWVLPGAQSALFLTSALNSFQELLKVSSLQWSCCNLCRGSWQVPTSSQQGPYMATYLTMLWGHFMAVVSRGAGKAHSQVYQRFHGQSAGSHHGRSHP